MPDFINLNNELQELLSLLEEDMSEKIMTKKQAKRKKALRAKKRAEKKAKQAEQQKLQAQQAQSNDNAVEAELVDDGGDNNGDGKDKSGENDKEFKALIVYDENADVTAEPKNYSQAFNEYIAILNKVIQKYSEMFQRANQLWEQAGKDKPCPQDAYNLFKEAIEQAQEEFSNLLDNELSNYADNMHEEELTYLETQFTAVNKFLEEYGKAIESLHPEELQLPDNLKDDVDKDNAVTTTDSDTELTSDKHKTVKHKSNKGKDLITFEDFGKLTKDTSNVWKAVSDAEQELAKTSWGEFIKKLNPTDWFEDRLWSFINSQVVNDFIKTLMYSNPITAMIYDGKLINFGIKSGLQKLKAHRDKQREARDKIKEQNKKKKEEFYDGRGLPRSLKDLTLDEMYKEYYGNYYFVDMVNTAYNHPNTAADDSIAIEEYTKAISQGFKDKNRATVYKNFSYLIKKLNEVADYQEWNTAKDFETARIEAGNELNKKRKQNDIDIYNASKKNNKTSDKNIESDIKGYISAYKQLNNDKNPKRDEIISALKQHANNEIEAELNNMGYQESYIITTRLQQLCENALA